MFSSFSGVLYSWTFSQNQMVTTKKEKMGTRKKAISSGGQRKTSQLLILPANIRRARCDIALIKAGTHSSTHR